MVRNGPLVLTLLGGVVVVGLVVIIHNRSCWWREKKQEWRRSRRRRRSGFPALVGDTPLVLIASLSRATGCRVFGKAEMMNPGGSSKDRVARSMVEEAEGDGRLLTPGGVIVEGTSGSTGISLALMAQAKGCRCVIVMPDDQAKEKQNLLRTFGAEIKEVRPCSISNNEHYCKAAESLANATPGAVYMDQFETMANFRAHYHGTGPEIWKQTEGDVDAFVMSAGTGGTIAGVSRYLKERRRDVKVFLADPPGSSLYHRVKSGVCFAPQQRERGVRRHRYDSIAEGIGIDRLTRNFLEARVDDAFRVSDQEAVDMAHHLLREDGLFVGSSTAMNCVAAVRAARKLGPGHSIVTVLCDSGQRHLTRFWNKAFIEEQGLVWPDRSNAPAPSCFTDEELR